jgi:hypothetical protein
MLPLLRASPGSSVYEIRDEPGPLFQGMQYSFRQGSLLPCNWGPDSDKNSCGIATSPGMKMGYRAVTRPFSIEVEAIFIEADLSVSIRLGPEFWSENYARVPTILKLWRASLRGRPKTDDKKRDMKLWL